MESSIILRQDAIDAIQTYCTGCENYNHTLCRTCEYAKAVKCVQMVKPYDRIVRCGECVYVWHDPDNYDIVWCNRLTGTFKMSPTDFCSKGVKKNEIHSSKE